MPVLGVADLSLDELVRVDHVFITHSHLDHLAALPLMIDSVADRRSTPVIVHATRATLEAIRKHVFTGRSGRISARFRSGRRR